MILAAVVAGCATVEMPQGKEEVREFTQETKVPYVAAYQLIAKQMRACYRVIGVFGNGYDIQADLDSASKTGHIELYHVGLTGASKPEDSSISRTVTVKEHDGGAIITINGTNPKFVYMNHLAIKNWLSGGETCGPGAQSK
jgi:hypothetical protein